MCSWLLVVIVVEADLAELEVLVLEACTHRQDDLMLRIIWVELPGRIQMVLGGRRRLTSKTPVCHRSPRRTNNVLRRIDGKAST